MIIIEFTEDAQGLPLLNKGKIIPPKHRYSSPFPN